MMSVKRFDNSYMVSYKFITFFLIFILVLFSCGEKEKPLKLLEVTEYSSSKVTDTSLVKILKYQNNLDINVEYTLSEDEALKQLEEKKVDLVIIPNNARSNNSEFRTIVPLLPRVLTILTNKKVDDMSLKDLFKNGTVYFEDRSRLDSIIFKKLYYNFDIDESSIQSKLAEDLSFNESSDSLKVYIGLTHVNNLLVRKLAHSYWHFFSLDRIDDYRKGSRIEGYTMMNTSGYPFVIPMAVYRGKPEKSVLTFAINDVLICRSDLDANVAYDITKTLIENKSQLIQLNGTYNLLNFNYDKQVLSFPKHKGTKNYLNRNEPPVWSKYAKMIWPLISISVVLFGILTSFRQRLKRRKKQNIEMYYNTLLDIRGKIDAAKEKDTFVEILKELKVLRSQAMKSLADKKLDSGESFNIFLALYNDTKNELIEDLKDVVLKTQENKS